MSYFTLRIKVGPSLRTPSSCLTDQDFAQVGKEEIIRQRKLKTRNICFGVTSKLQGGVEGRVSVVSGRGWRHYSLLTVLVFMGSMSTSRERVSGKVKVSKVKGNLISLKRLRRRAFHETAFQWARNDGSRGTKRRFGITCLCWAIRLPYWKLRRGYLFGSILLFIKD